MFRFSEETVAIKFDLLLTCTKLWFEFSEFEIIFNIDRWLGSMMLIVLDSEEMPNSSSDERGSGVSLMSIL